MRKWLPLLLALMLCLVCTAAMAECEHESETIVPNTDGTHSFICEACSAETYKEECADSCDDSDTACDWCGSTAGKPDNYHMGHSTVCTIEGGKGNHACSGCGVIMGSYDVEWIPEEARPSGMTGHFAECSQCGKEGANETPHTYKYTSTADGHTGECTVCGWAAEAEGHFTQAVDNGDGTHDIVCKYCGYATYDDDMCFESSCANYDGKCDVCGGANPADFYHEDSECTPNGDGTHSILCTTCGTDLNGGPGACFDDCTAPDGKCDWCGGSDAPVEHYYNENYVCEECGHVGCPHETLTCSGTGAVHTATCVDCGAAVGEYPVETTPWSWLEHAVGCGICGMNDKMTLEACTITNKSTADVCSYVCTVCNYDWSTWNDGKHYFDEYTYTNDDHTTVCISCGYAVTEAHVYADENDNDCDVCGKTKKCQHTYWYKVSKQATCTEDGVRVDYCNLCGKEHGTQAIPAKGHDLSTEDIGDYILESCSRCDYENKIEKAAEQPAEEVPAEEAPVTDGLQIAEADETVTLPETVTAVKAFTVAMMKDGQSIQPEEATTVTLALTEEELTAINGLKLVAILADGTVTEIPYEVVDGQIVFTAETLGVFAFVAK